MKIKNGYSHRKNGWLYISVKGTPKERGFAYGYYCADVFKEIQKMLQYYIFESYGYSWDYFIEKINSDFHTMTKEQYYELYQEMEGIAEGCSAGGCKTTIDEIIAWNFYCSIPYWFSFTSNSHVGKEGGGKKAKELTENNTFIMVPKRNRANDKCSAFMAVGDWTKDGKIVVAHNSFCDYIDGQYSNVILDINPTNGYRIMMQTSPCWIWSGTDFFITSGGIIGTETTIGGFQPYKKNIPIGYRIRTAMQYATDIDDYISLLVNGDSGDYANSWLIGDIKTNEIARIELGLKFHSVDRTKNGYLIGFNAPYDPRIRNIDVVNSGFYDIRRHQGARRVRLEQLMIKHKGKLNVELAKKILADHYDVYLKKNNNPCSRTICSHYDLDSREYMSQADRPPPYAPHGAVDGMACDTAMAKNLSFVGRFGNSCGLAFNKDKYCKENIQFSNICHFLKDRPSQPWTFFQVHNFNKKDLDARLSANKSIKKDEIARLIKRKGNAPVEINAPSTVKYFTVGDNVHIDRKYYTDETIHYIPNNTIIQSLSPQKINNDKPTNSKRRSSFKKERQALKTRKQKSFNKKTKKNVKTQ